MISSPGNHLGEGPGGHGSFRASRGSDVVAKLYPGAAAAGSTRALCPSLGRHGLWGFSPFLTLLRTVHNRLHKVPTCQRACWLVNAQPGGVQLFLWKMADKWKEILSSTMPLT